MKIEEQPCLSMSLGVDKRETTTIQKRREGGFHRRRPRRRVHAENAAVQRLFQASKAIFKGPAGTVPLPKDVHMLQIFLDKLRPEDFGLSTDLDFFRGSSPQKGTPPITYTTIYNCDTFSMCMFFLPPNSVIPLHNHPEMTVFSKLLLGTMHITSYDWVDSAVSKSSSSKFKLARMVVDSCFTAPCRTSTLYPTAGGNMHTFRAITPCVVLDVLGPPYSKEDDRDCTYYRNHPFSHVSDGCSGNVEEHDDGVCWLEEIEMPKDLRMVGVEYLGPQIIDR